MILSVDYKRSKHTETMERQLQYIILNENILFQEILKSYNTLFIVFQLSKKLIGL